MVDRVLALREADRENGLGELGAGADFLPDAIEVGARTALGGEEFVPQRIINHAE